MGDIFDSVTEEPKSDVFDQLEASPDSFEGQLAAQGLTEKDYEKEIASVEAQAPKEPARGFFGGLAKGFGHSFEATAKGPGVFTLSDEILKGELQKAHTELTGQEPPGKSGRAGEFIGGLGGVLAQAVPIGIAAKKPGIAAMFGSIGAYDAFIRAGVRAMEEGKSLDDAVSIGRKTAMVAAPAQAAVAAVLPTGAPGSLGEALVSGLRPAAAGAAAVGAENVTQRALGLKTPLSEGVAPTALTMGLLPAGGHLASRAFARVFVPRSIQALQETEGREPLTIPYRTPSSLEPGVLQPAGAATFVSDPAGRTIAFKELSPLEQTEAMRGPRAFTPREEQVRPAQAEPVVIGESQAAKLARQEPEIIQPVGEVVPASQAATAPGKTEAGGEISFGAAAEAKAIPSALQSAQEQPPGIIRGTSAEKWADRILGEDPRGGKVQLGFDPVKDSKRVAAVAIKGAALIEQGLRDFGKWSAEMVSQYGEAIKPHLDDLWKRSQRVFDTSTARKAASPASPQALGITPPGARVLGQVIEAFKPKAQAVLPKTASTAGEALPDLGNRAENKVIAAEPTGVGRIPVLNWFLDPRHRAKTDPEKAILGYFYEQGVGQAHVKALASTFGTKFKKLFPRNEAGEFTNVGRVRADQSLHPSDVFEALQRNPNSYRLSPLQRQAFDELMRYEKRARQLEKQYDLSESGAQEPYYTRGKVIGEPPQKRGMGGGSVGGRQFFQKARKFDTEQQGVTKGFAYPMNVDDRILARLSRIYKAIGDKRLADDADLSGRWGTDSGPITYQEGQVFQPAFRRGLEYKIFPTEVAGKLNTSLADQQTQWLKSLQSINDATKSLTLGFDWGAGQIQGLITAFRNPAAWAKAQTTSLQAFGDKDAFAAYMRGEANTQAARELAQFGSGVSSLPEMVVGLGEGGVLSRIPRAVGKSVAESGLPRVGKAISATAEVPEAFGRLFSTFLDVAKIEKWKARREFTPREEWPRAIQEIEHELNMGRMEAIGVNPGQALAERLLLLAPSFYRGGLGQIGDMAAKGTTGAQARRAMGSYMAGIIATFGAGAVAVGMPWEEIKNRLKPSNGNFMMIPLKFGGKSLEVGFGGIMRSFMRLGGAVYKTSMEHPENWGSLSSEKNPFTKWLRGHSSPIVSKAWEQFSGKDYAGEDADMKSLGRGSLPLFLQSWLKQEKGQTGGQTAADMIFSFSGLLSWPQNTRNKILVERNRLAKEKFGGPYENLSMREQARVTRELERKPEFQKEPSTPRQIEQAFRRQVEREEQVQAGLEKPFRDVLEEKGLRIHGFEPTLKVGPTVILLTGEQMDRYKELIVEEYNRMLKSRVGILSKRTTKRGQDLLDDWAEQAKNRARIKLQAEFNRK